MLCAMRFDSCSSEIFRVTSSTVTNAPAPVPAAAAAASFRVIVSCTFHHINHSVLYNKAICGRKHFFLFFCPVLLLLFLDNTTMLTLLLFHSACTVIQSSTVLSFHFPPPCQPYQTSCFDSVSLRSLSSSSASPSESGGGEGATPLIKVTLMLWTMMIRMLTIAFEVHWTATA